MAVIPGPDFIEPLHSNNLLSVMCAHPTLGMTVDVDFLCQYSSDGIPHKMEFGRARRNMREIFELKRLCGLGLCA